MNTPAPPCPQNLHAWRSGKAHLCFWLVALAGFAGDFLSKLWILRTLGDPLNGFLRPPLVLIDSYLWFITVFNRGAVTGIAQGKTAFLLCASAMALIFLIWMFAHSLASHTGIHFALGIILGGAMGNLYDRIFREGYVVDFIEVNLHVWPADPWPTFNVADALLCVGVALLLIHMFRQRRREQKKTTSPSSP